MTLWDQGMAVLAESLKNFSWTPPDPFAEFYDFDVPYEEEAVVQTALLGFLDLKSFDDGVMSEGNQKLDKRVLIFNLPPVKSCPNNASCRASCYAIPFYRQYPNVWERYDSNFNMAKTRPGWLSYQISKQIEKKKKSRAGLVAVRVHSSGDFFSQEYLDMWAGIAAKFPDVNFYAYTKADKILDFRRLDAAPNFNVIRSFIDGRFRNYGDPKYVAKVKDAVPDAFICPAIHNPAIHCGAQCNYCIQGSKPLFYIHGTMRQAGEIAEHRYDWEGYKAEKRERELRSAAANAKKARKRKVDKIAAAA